jgi:inner membrane protein
MEKKTHVVCANAIALGLIRQDNIPSLLITCGFASLGGLLPDVDLKDSTTDKLFDRLMTSLITVVVMYFLIKYFLGIDLYDEVKKIDIVFNYIISLVIFIIMGYLGSKTSHRSFTHSILGCFVYTFILSYGFRYNVLIPFLCGFISHIVLDLFNKKGIALLYPCKSRFCFNLCESNGKTNKLLFIIFSCLIVLILILIGMEII